MITNTIYTMPPRKLPSTAYNDLLLYVWRPMALRHRGHNPAIYLTSMQCSCDQHTSYVIQHTCGADWRQQTVLHNDRGAENRQHPVAVQCVRNPLPCSTVNTNLTFCSYFYKKLQWPNQQESSTPDIQNFDHFILWFYLPSPLIAIAIPLPMSRTIWI